MAIKPRGKGIPPVTSYQAILDLLNRVVAEMTGNPDYTTPVPTLASLTAQSVILAAAIAAWGPKGARGSHSDLMNLRAASLTARNLLVQELGYVVNTAVLLGGDYATQAAAIISSGFGVKNAPVPQGTLGQPENFHQQFLNRISIWYVGLKWKKPIGVTSPGNVKNYQIYRGTVDNFNDPGTVIIGTSTRTSFIDTSVAGARTHFYYYWCTASNDAGIGAPTASVTVAPIP